MDTFLQAAIDEAKKVAAEGGHSHRLGIGDRQEDRRARAYGYWLPALCSG